MLSRPGMLCAQRRAKCHPGIKKCHHGKRGREPQRCTFLFSRAGARDACLVITGAAEVNRWRRLLAHGGNEVRGARDAAAATCGGRDTASTVYSLLVVSPRELGVCVTRWSNHHALLPRQPRVGCIRCVHSETRGRRRSWAALSCSRVKAPAASSGWPSDDRRDRPGGGHHSTFMGPQGLI